MVIINQERSPITSKGVIVIASPSFRQGEVVGSSNLALGTELSARGYKVLLIIPGRVPDRPYARGLEVLSWPNKGPNNPRSMLWFLRILRKSKAVCTIGHFSSENICLLGGMISGVRKRISWYHTPTTMLDLDSNLSPRLLRFIRARKRLLYKLANYIVPVSHSAGEDLERSFGVPQSKIVVHRNSLIDPATEYPESLEYHRRPPGRILCVGRLFPTKGQDILLRATALVKAMGHNFSVDLVGDGPAHDSLVDLCAQLNIVERVRFLGALPHNEVLKSHLEATMSIVPSRRDAGALTMLESMAMGTPCIATDIGSTSEFMTHGKEGLLFAENSHEELAERIRSLLTDRDLCSTISHLGRIRFLSSFERSSNMQRQADWLDSILAGSPRSN